MFSSESIRFCRIFPGRRLIFYPHTRLYPRTSWLLPGNYEITCVQISGARTDHLKNHSDFIWFSANENDEIEKHRGRLSSNRKKSPSDIRAPIMSDAIPETCPGGGSCRTRVIHRFINKKYNIIRKKCMQYTCLW